MEILEIGLTISCFLNESEGDVILSLENERTILAEEIVFGAEFNWIGEEDWELKCGNIEIDSNNIRDMKEKNGKLILFKKDVDDRIILEIL